MTNKFEQEKNRKAGAYTLVITAMMLLLFFIINWRIPLKETPLLNEGIEVNLGNSETGLGDIAPTMPGEPAPEQAEQVSATPKSSPPVVEPIATDEDNNEPDAPVIPKTVAKTVVKPKQQTNQNIPPAVKPKEEPPAPPQPKPKAVLGAYKGGTGNGGNNQDEFNNKKNQGIAGGTGDQGKANGNINNDNYKGDGGTGNSGVAISRGLTGKRITKFPSFEDEFNENAKIAVDIRVNETGAVTSAVYSSRGSTSGSATLKAIAIKKAYQLKFNDGDNESSGTVIFNFRLKG